MSQEWFTQKFIENIFHDYFPNTCQKAHTFISYLFKCPLSFVQISLTILKIWKINMEKSYEITWLKKNNNLWFSQFSINSSLFLLNQISCLKTTGQNVTKYLILGKSQSLKFIFISSYSRCFNKIFRLNLTPLLSFCLHYSDNKNRLWLCWNDNWIDAICQHWRSNTSDKHYTQIWNFLWSTLPMNLTDTT